jgi:hypothetical protein
MIFDAYYKFEKLTPAKFRYDATQCTNLYDYFERLLINQRSFNVGGLSFNYVDRPNSWKRDEGRRAEKAITKGNHNVSSVFIPSLNTHLIGYGDINNTPDALILMFDATYTIIEVFIAKGYANDILALYTLVKEGEYNHEFELLRSNSKNSLKCELPIK